MRNARSVVGVASMIALLGAGCTSGHPTAHPPSTSTTVAPATHTTKDAAIELAGNMLDRFVPPPGSSITRAETNRYGPYSGIVDATHIVTQRREWIVTGSSDTTLKFLLEHVPSGFRRFNDFSPITRVADKHVLRWDLQETLRPVPPNVDRATLDLGIVPGAGNLDLTVDAKVQWADLRPAATFAPAGERVVIVKLVREEAQPRVLRRVVISDASRVAGIVRAFNSLPVSAPGMRSCSPPPGTPVSYRISFAASPESTPDRGAAMSLTCGIGITVRSVNLDDPNFALYNALGPELRSTVS